MVCSDCGGSQLTWELKVLPPPHTSAGQLFRIHDMSAALILGCEECSATLRIVVGDEAASLVPLPAE